MLNEVVIKLEEERKERKKKKKTATRKHHKSSPCLNLLFIQDCLHNRFPYLVSSILYFIFFKFVFGDSRRTRLQKKVCAVLCCRFFSSFLSFSISFLVMFSSLLHGPQQEGFSLNHMPLEIMNLKSETFISGLDGICFFQKLNK